MCDWDILNLEDDDWHLQILDHLHDEGVDCYFVDMWLDDVVIVMGYRGGGYPSRYEISTALNIPEDIVYYDHEHAFVFINLYQLKAIRCGADKLVKKYEIEQLGD